MRLETVSLMNKDTEEYEVTYDIDTYDIVEWVWKGIAHPLWTSGVPFKGYSLEEGKGLMRTYFASRVWEQGSIVSDVLLAHFNLEKYDLRRIAQVTMGTNCLSCVSLWMRFEQDKDLTWQDVIDIQNKRWEGAEEKCNTYYHTFVAPLTDWREGISICQSD